MLPLELVSSLAVIFSLSQAWLSLELVASLTFSRLVSSLAVNITSVKLDC